MSDPVLVFAEQQGGKITRPTWEALAAGQRLASDTGCSPAAVVLGDRAASLAAELAVADLAEVVALESPALAEYTPDGYATALAELIRARQPRPYVREHPLAVCGST
jgi:electron transfer flavoprotein alpha subunit